MMLTFALGCLGALVPEVLRLYKLRRRLPRLHWSYFLISVIYAGVAGVFALFLAKDGNPLSALYIGVGLPSIVAVARKSAVGEPAQQDGDEPLDVELVDVEPVSLRSRFIQHFSAL